MSRATELLTSGIGSVTQVYAQQSDDHLGVDQVPVLPLSGSFFHYIHHSQIQYFLQTIINHKHRFGFSCLAQLAVEPLIALMV